MATTNRQARKERTGPKSRELAKHENRHRILQAARKFFAEVGYDRATLRQIAAHAGVTTGAVFKHVTDKRDLVHLIFSEEVDALTKTALASPRSYQTLGEKILLIAEHYYRHFGSDPVLSRILLSEMLVETPGLHLERSLDIRERLLRGIEHLVIEAQNSGEIRSSVNARKVTRQIFFVYSAALRYWINSSERPKWREGIGEYKLCLEMQIEGLIPRPQAKASAEL